MRFRPSSPALALIALAIVSPLGCGGGDEQGAGGGSSASASKEVVVDGSSTVYLISRAAVEAYKEAKPDVTVVADKSGTGPGFGKYIRGEVEIIGASRAAKPKEEEDAKSAGHTPWTRYLVGYDGITVVVAAKNDFVKELTVAQLKSLFGPDSKVTSWKDLDPSWPDRRINVFSPDNNSGTFEFFTEAINGKAKAQRKGVQQSTDDNQLVLGVADDVDAIGYFGFAYYAANKAKLKAVAVKKDDKTPAVMPSTETILDKSYSPLARPLYLYVKDAAMKRPEVADFVKFYVEGAAKLAEKAGYVPPTAEDAEANKKALSAQTSGPKTSA